MSDLDSTSSPPNSTNKPIAVISIESQLYSSTVSDLESPPVGYERRSKKRRLSMPPKKATKHHGLHVSQKKVELTAATQQAISVEKNLVKFRIPHDEITSLNSSLWGTVKHVDWGAMIQYRTKQIQDKQELEISKYRGLMKLYTCYDEEMKKPTPNMTKRLCICALCFDDPNKSLLQSIVGTGNLATSNIKQHVNSYHDGNPGPLLYTSALSVSTKKGGASSNNYKGSATKSVESTQSSMSRFAQKLPTTKMEARSLVKSSIYKCVNDLGFPAATVEKPVFRNLLQCVYENAQLINPRDLVMSTRTLTRVRVDSYMEYVRVVQTFARGVMGEYIHLCGKPVPCATICHDVWQGHKKDILGIVVMVADPRNCQMYKIPIGFIHVHAHNAELVADLTRKLLHTFGFSVVFINATVNDNTNSAILASKYISNSDEGGKCDMHKAELMIKHATGLATRSKDKRICDSNPSFVNVYKKFFAFASWLMSGHAKSRIENLKAYSIQRNKVVVDIVIPNATRVAGCVLLIQFLMRNKFPMDEYCFRLFGGDAEFKKRYPTQAQWNQLSQFEGVLAPLQRFSISLQSDEAATGCAAVVQAYMSFFEVYMMKQQGVRCISLNGDDYTADQTWDGASTMKQLDVKRKLIPWDECLPATKILVNRFLKEFRTYMLNKRDNDGEKALIGNPLTCVAMPALFYFIKFYNDGNKEGNIPSDRDRLESLFVGDMVRRFKVARNPAAPAPVPSPSPVAAAGAAAAAAAPTPATDNTVTATSTTEAVSPPVNPPPVSAPVELSVGDIFKRFALKKKQEKTISSSTADQATSRATEKEQLAKMVAECKQAFKQYISWCETEMDDWAGAITRFPSERYRRDSNKWNTDDRAVFVENCENKNYLEVGMYFDVLAWWQQNKTKFPKIFPSALIALTKPPTNAFVERGFSGASHFDSNRLMRRELPKNFEMRTMDAQTRELRDRLMTAEKALGDLESAKQALLDDYNKLNRTEGEEVPTKASTRSLLDLTTYWSRFQRAQQVAGTKVQSKILKFILDGSKQTTTTRPRTQQQTTASPTTTRPSTQMTLFGVAAPSTEEAEEEEEITYEVDDKVDEYTTGEADEVQLVDLSYDSEDEATTELDEYDPEDNDVVLLESLQEKLHEEETGIIHIEDRPVYRRAGYVDMTGDEEDFEPILPVLPIGTPRTPSTPKRKSIEKDDGSSVVSSKKTKTPEIPPRSYTPRKAKEVAAMNANKKAQQKTKGKKRARKVDDMYETSSEEDEEEEEEEHGDEE